MHTYGITIVYRPVHIQHAGWFAWVAKDADEHKPPWARRLVWWPISESMALSWYAGFGWRRK